MSDRDTGQDRDRAIARFVSGRAGGNDGGDVDPASHKQVDDAWRDLDTVAEHPAVRAMREQALARLDAPPAGQPRWRMPVMGALAASLVAVVSIGIAHRPVPPAPPAQQDEGQVIANGQQMPRQVDLADGTRITLDSHTQLHLDRGGRLVRLDYGRAFFKVHHDEAHPFAVKVGEVTVSDIGTHFEVTQDGGGIAVTLVEGKVRVDRAGASTMMTPGQRLRLEAGRQTVTMLDTAQQTLWQSGMIRADDMPVRDVLAQFNRYRAQPLSLGDPSLGSMRISGEFRLDDPQEFLAAVTALKQGGA